MKPIDIQKQAKAKGLRMQSILTTADVNRSTWWRWKTGKTSPSLDTVDRINQAITNARPK
jgi:transcriptional regulator with XRE-family HTH domain